MPHSSNVKSYLLIWIFCSACLIAVKGADSIAALWSTTSEDYFE